MSKPIIGISLDSEREGDYSKFPYYVLRKNYIEAVEQAGGIPILFSHELSLIDDYINMIDGLLIPGGDFDIDPSFYGEEIASDTVTMKKSRADFEREFIEKAFKKEIPILGICAGMQLMNVYFGGSLIQHIPDEIESFLEHEQKVLHDIATHEIDIVGGSILNKITGSTKMEVNSSHHQAVKDLGKGLEVSATAPDGVIEAIELRGHKFCVGVEWHPEYLIKEEDENIFKAFVAACV